ncbi:MAG: hypothetical protein IPK84_04930 [Candidatus Moraniibacteriota bacterium]|nr:MAG: hypothetical protein IPK84_04930 [Candidatus Moranbacteria bacterium]
MGRRTDGHCHCQDFLREGSPTILVERADRISPQEIETWQRAILTRKKYGQPREPVGELGIQNKESDKEREATHNPQQTTDNKQLTTDSEETKTTQPSRHSAIQPSNNQTIQNKNIIITLDDTATEKTLEHLADTLKRLPTGDTKVCIRLRGKTIETHFSIDATPKTTETLKENTPKVETR